MGTSSAPPVEEVRAGPPWGSVDLISDLHLQPQERATFEAWRRYLQATPADAVFILGDLFEAWVGDDAALQPGFEAECAQVLQEAAARRPIFFLHGNRDFLIGEGLARQCGLTLMADPCVLDFAGQRWLLTHGDALCLDDTEYLRFRAQVRSPQWRADFLGRPLAERQAVARQLREASQARAPMAAGYADVDTAAAREALVRADARVMVHGHTHRPGEHDLGDGLRRIVLSDWDAAARPPRLQALRLHADGRIERVALG